MGMRGARGQVFALVSFVVMLSCGGRMVDDGSYDDRGGFGGDVTVGGTRTNEAGTPSVAGAGGRRMNNGGGAGGRHSGGQGGVPVAGATFGGQPFGGFGGSFGG